MEDWPWLFFLFLLAIPLARIIPRALVMFRDRSEQPGMRNPDERRIYEQKGYEPVQPDPPMRASMPEPEGKKERESHATANVHNSTKAVMTALTGGALTFEAIQKRTGLNGGRLEMILAEIEDKGFLNVIHTSGFWGSKVKMTLSEKGFREIYR